jgi:hypothetical protein
MLDEMIFRPLALAGSSGTCLGISYEAYGETTVVPMKRERDAAYMDVNVNAGL